MSGTDSTAANAGLSGARHSIRTVERRTGLSQHVLRAWERRYGVLQPARTASGERLYSEADVERLRLVRHAIVGGRRVGSVIGLPLESLRELVSEDSIQSAPATTAAAGGTDASSRLDARLNARLDARVDSRVDACLDACVDAARETNPNAAYVLLMQAAAALDAVSFIETVAAPLLRVVGAEWEAGTLPPSGEHAVSSALRRVTSWLLETMRAQAEAPLILVGTLPEQRHEFGASFAAITAATGGWRVSYMDGDLPVDDIAHAASLSGADVVALSLVTSPGGRVLRRDAAQLRSLLPDSVPLIAGGAGALRNHRALEGSGFVVMRDLRSWGDWLDGTRARLRPR